MTSAQATEFNLQALEKRAQEAAARVAQVVAGAEAASADLDAELEAITAASTSAIDDVMNAVVELLNTLESAGSWRESVEKELSEQLAVMVSEAYRAGELIVTLSQSCEVLGERAERWATQIHTHLSSLRSDLEEGVQIGATGVVEDLGEAADNSMRLVGEGFAEMRSNLEDAAKGVREGAESLRKGVRFESDQLGAMIDNTQAGLWALLNSEMTHLASAFEERIGNLHSDLDGLVSRIEAIRGGLVKTTESVNTAVDGAMTAAEITATGLQVALDAFDSVRQICDEIEDAFG